MPTAGNSYRSIQSDHPVASAPAPAPPEPAHPLSLPSSHCVNRGHVCYSHWDTGLSGQRTGRVGGSAAGAPSHHDLAQFVVPGTDILHQHLEGSELELGGQWVELLLLHLLELYPMAKLPHELDPKSGLGPENVRNALSPGRTPRALQAQVLGVPGWGSCILPNPCASGCQALPGAALPVARPPEVSAASVSTEEGGKRAAQGMGACQAIYLGHFLTTWAAIQPAKQGPSSGAQKDTWGN